MTLRGIAWLRVKSEALDLIQNVKPENKTVVRAGADQQSAVEVKVKGQGEG